MTDVISSRAAGRRTGVRTRLRQAADRLPLRIKMVVTVLLLTVGALVAADIAATTALRGYLLGRVDTQLVGDAANVVGSGGRAYSQGPNPDGDRFRPPTEYFISTADAQGNAQDVLSNPARAGQSAPKLPKLTVAQTTRQPKPFTVPAQAGGAPWRVVAVAVVFSDGRSGSLYVGTNLGDLNSTLSHLGALELGTGLVVLALLGGLAYLLVRSSLRPLVEVEETAAAIAAGDLSRRVPDHHPRTEVGRLSAALNGMLGQIETAFGVQRASESAARASEQRMRRFVTDASHELRTPLTSIRGFAELYRQGAVGQPADVARYMKHIEDSAARMGLLVDDLLLLARLDQQRPLEQHPVDLLAVASDAVHEARAAAPGRPVTLQAVEGPVPPVVVGDDSRLRQVLGNLVGNALTHTPDGTSVAVRVGTRRAEGSSVPVAFLEVVDNGPGLAPADAERVFERFYRADPSRNRSLGGSGLGLSIVAALVAAHGGRVEVDTAPGQGATFRVLLPAESASAEGASLTAPGAHVLADPVDEVPARGATMPTVAGSRSAAPG